MQRKPAPDQKPPAGQPGLDIWLGTAISSLRRSAIFDSEVHHMAMIRKLMHMAMIPVLISAVTLPASADSKRQRGSHHISQQILAASGEFCSVPGAYEDVSARDEELRAQIVSELQTGQLTATQSTCLMCMLAQVKRAQRDYEQGSNGLLSLAQVNALRVAQNSVSIQLHRATNNPLMLLNPDGVGFNLPYLGYPNGMNLPCSAARRITSVAPWWMM